MGVGVAVCVPFPFLIPVKEALAGSKVGLGAQDCYYESAGAYTAAVSTSMLGSVGCDYIVCGHSERRATFGDTDEDVNKKTLKILSEGLKPILCIGELKEERESGPSALVLLRLLRSHKRRTHTSVRGSLRTTRRRSQMASSSSTAVQLKLTTWMS